MERGRGHPWVPAGAATETVTPSVVSRPQPLDVLSLIGNLQGGFWAVQEQALQARLLVVLRSLSLNPQLTLSTGRDRVSGWQT